MAEHVAQPQTARSPLDGIEMGIGAWAWGDRIVWDYGGSYRDSDVHEAYVASVNAGITLFDTAELYGFGTSERLLGRFMRETGTRPRIATKFMPIPYRFMRRQLLWALRGSLKRLGVERVELYQIHWTPFVRSIEFWADALADAMDEGLTEAVGVSNYSGNETRRTAKVLARRGYTLASNQVDYSLLERSIERNGTMRACEELGVRVIAYSPLGMGILTGKYTPENPPSGYRAGKYRRLLVTSQPLVALLKTIGEQYGKTPAQVALNWTICNNTLPIPGAKNAQQAQQNAGAQGWRLSPDEVAALDEASDAAVKKD